MSLLGQLAAFGFFLYYLRLGGMDARFSLLLALAFLLDPLCDIGWRGGRMDGWAFAFLFACISAIRRARGRPEADRGARWAAWLGGAAAACGFLCWPSFAMFTPLIVLEIWALVREPAGYFIPASLFAAGGVVAAALIIVPFRREFMYGLADARLLTSMQSIWKPQRGIRPAISSSSFISGANSHRRGRGAVRARAEAQCSTAGGIPGCAGLYFRHDGLPASRAVPAPLSVYRGGVVVLAGPGTASRAALEASRGMGSRVNADRRGRLHCSRDHVIGPFRPVRKESRGAD